MRINFNIQVQSFTKGKEAERNNNGISYHPDNKTKKIISPKKREIELDDDSVYFNFNFML